MAALSSMMRIRRLTRAVKLSISGLRIAARQLENERRTASQPVAHRMQRSAEFLSGERAAVQAETVPGLAGGEAMSEKAAHILCGDAHAIVNDADAHAVYRTLDA